MVAVLGRMVRLSFYDNVVEKLDKGIAALLPPRPAVRPLPPPGSPAEEPADVGGAERAAERKYAAEMMLLVRF